MKKRFAVSCGALMLAAMMSACGGSSTASTTAATTAAETTETAAETTAAEATEATEAAAEEVTAPASDVAMQYISQDDAAAKLGEAGYTFLDLRKAEDYAAGHVPGAVNADMDACLNGDFANGVETMKPVVEGKDDNLVLICYSGKRYAQNGTNVLSALGYDMSKVFTLEGGMKAYTGELEK